MSARRPDATWLRPSDIQILFLQEKGGQLCPSIDARFAVDHHRVLQHRPLASIGLCGNLFMSKPLKQQDRHLALRGRQPPRRELCADGATKAGQDLFSTGTPQVPLGLSFAQRALRLPQRVPDCRDFLRRIAPRAPEVDQTAGADKDRREFNDRVRRRPSLAIEPQIRDAANDDQTENDYQHKRRRTRDRVITSESASLNVGVSYVVIDNSELDNHDIRKTTSDVVVVRYRSQFNWSSTPRSPPHTPSSDHTQRPARSRSPRQARPRDPRSRATTSPEPPHHRTATAHRVRRPGTH